MEKYAIQELLQFIEVFAELASNTYVKVYGPFARSKAPGDRRKFVVVVDQNGKRRTISLPKFIYEEATGIKLKDNESIDHKDYDIDNNSLDNLQVMDRSEHSKMDTRRVKLHKFICGECNKEFERSPRLVRDKSRKGVSGIFCSRQCSGRYNRKVQLGLAEKLPTQPYVESEYYRLKNVAEVASFIIEKYGLDI